MKKEASMNTGTIRERITICVPVHNGAHTIRKTLMSILNQTYQNIAVIVCDNASTDNTREIVTQIADERLEYRYFEEYLDVNYSFIRSLNCAEDEIICLFHADDFYYPTIVEEQYACIMKDEVGAVFSKIISVLPEKLEELVEQTDHTLDVFDYERYVVEALEKGTIFCCPTCMVRKTVLQNTGILEAKEDMISDMSFWLRIVRNYKICRINKVLMNYRRSPEQLSSQIFDRPRMTVSPQFLILDKELKDIKDNQLFYIPKEVLCKYEERRRSELRKIYHNLKDAKRPFIQYLLIICGLKRLRLKTIAKSEKDYLDFLYGRK